MGRVCKGLGWGTLAVDTDPLAPNHIVDWPPSHRVSASLGSQPSASHGDKCLNMHLGSSYNFSYSQKILK